MLTSSFSLSLSFSLILSLSSRRCADGDGESEGGVQNYLEGGGEDRAPSTGIQKSCGGAADDRRLSLLSSPLASSAQGRGEPLTDGDGPCHINGGLVSSYPRGSPNNQRLYLISAR